MIIAGCGWKGLCGKETCGVELRKVCDQRITRNLADSWMCLTEWKLGGICRPATGLRFTEDRCWEGQEGVLIRRPLATLLAMCLFPGFMLNEL